VKSARFYLASPTIRAVNHAPAGRSRWHAVGGWLLGLKFVAVRWGRAGDPETRFRYQLARVVSDRRFWKRRIAERIVLNQP
jgi:hypothetical protein